MLTHSSHTHSTTHRYILTPHPLPFRLCADTPNKTGMHLHSTLPHLQSQVTDPHLCYSPTLRRYIYTRLAGLTRHIFNKSDDKLLSYLNEEGQSIEPEW